MSGRRRTVLVTGGAGFIGSGLARLLAERDWRVRIVDDLSVGRRAYLAGVPHQLIEASLADRRAVAGAVEGTAAIVHLAARASVPDSVSDPLGTFEVNVTQTLGLLEAARAAGVRRFVFASSSAAAGNHEPPIDESVLPHPISPYGASKLAGEAFCQAYAAAFGIAACALRFSNVYGPRSLHKSSVVANWFRAALAGRPVIIYGDGEQSRDLIHVDDISLAILAALERPADAVAGEIFQVGTGRETTMNALAGTIERIVGRPLEIARAPARAGDIRRHVSGVDKAAQRLGFRAEVALEDGLRRTADWLAQALQVPDLAAIGVDSTSGSD
ncbi:MAG: hypothetical protein A2X23_05385 [Chloroflexi bacterium GWC2_73_18]|nr:MAG: hypothetical protein A2X23_05385 [Chloroflexi bacterium GWC2_73_18]